MALGKIELSQGKNKSYTVWMDDEKLLNEVPFELDCEYSEGSSSKNTEELLDEDQDYIDDIWSNGISMVYLLSDCIKSNHKEYHLRWFSRILRYS